MPTPRKASDRRQRGGTDDVQIIHAGPIVAAPEPRLALNDAAKNWWHAFWETEAARAADPATDGPLVSRWAVYMAEWERCNAALDAEGPLSTGSKGQAVQHPLFRQRDELEGRIAAIEQQLGLTPKARATLGLTLTAYRGAVASLDAIRNMPPEVLAEAE